MAAVRRRLRAWRPAGTRPTARSSVGTARQRRALARLRDRPLNYSPADLPGGGRHHDAAPGWRVEEDAQPLPGEPPGPPVSGGAWERARRLVAGYAFADPRIVRAVYDPDTPLRGRDLLLVGRFYGLRFHMGVRVSGVTDEQASVGGRQVRVWGWAYDTLEGHLEAGRMAYEVRKWVDTGEVEFRMRRYERLAPARGGVVGLGWRVFGRWTQRRFDRRARQRMRHLVRH